MGKAAAGEKIQVPGGDADFDAFCRITRRGLPARPLAVKRLPGTFYKLSPEERLQMRAAMGNYFGTLKKEKLAHTSMRFEVRVQWLADFVPPPVDKAKQAADELQNQIRCVAIDISERRHLMAKKWWKRPEDVPADIREKALAHAIKEYLYEPSAA